MSKYIPVLLFFFQIAIAQPDSLIKYFSTNIMRTNVLKGKPEKSVDKKEAHFKAVYYPSGELKSIEFLPANWDKKKRKKTKSPGRVTLYYLKWNPKTQELLEGLTRREARAWPHYKAIVDDQGLVREVDYVSRNGKTQWTFYMKWDDYGKSKEYDIEFHSKKYLSQLNKELFSPDMSMVRPGWISRYKIEENGAPKSVEVMDRLENLYYFYQFNYSKRKLQSQYFTADSTLIGSHTVKFNQKRKPIRIAYYNKNGVMKNAIEYEYPKDAKMIVSQLNSKNQVIQRTLIPKKGDKK